MNTFLKHKSFKVAAEYLEGTDVHFGKNSKISECLGNDGVAALRVTHGGNNAHYVLALEIHEGEGGKALHCFDPYPMSKPRDAEGYEYLDPKDPHGPNLHIRMDWLTGDPDKKKFRLGKEDERECLLLRKRK